MLLWIATPRVLQTLLSLFLFSRAIIFDRGHLATAILGRHLNRTSFTETPKRGYQPYSWYPEAIMSSSDIVAHSMMSNPSCLTSADGDDATHMTREKTANTNQHKRFTNRWTKRPTAQNESGQTVESIPTPSFLRKNEPQSGNDTVRGETHSNKGEKQKVPKGKRIKPKREVPSTKAYGILPECASRSPKTDCDQRIIEVDDDFCANDILGEESQSHNVPNDRVTWPSKS